MLGMVMGLSGLRAKFLQDTFTQKMGILLAGLGKFNDASRDNFVGEIAPVRKAKGRADHFECHPHDALGLGVERHPVQVGSYRHGALLHALRREHDRSLSHRRLTEGRCRRWSYPMPTTTRGDSLNGLSGGKIIP